MRFGAIGARLNPGNVRGRFALHPDSFWSADFFVLAEIYHSPVFSLREGFQTVFFSFCHSAPGDESECDFAVECFALGAALKALFAAISEPSVPRIAHGTAPAAGTVEASRTLQSAAASWTGGMETWRARCRPSDFDANQLAGRDRVARCRLDWKTSSCFFRPRATQAVGGAEVRYRSLSANDGFQTRCEMRGRGRENAIRSRRQNPCKDGVLRLEAAPGEFRADREIRPAGKSQGTPQE